MAEYNPYRVDRNREEMLEEFYSLMVSIDVIGGIREQLIDEDEMEAWAELTVLHEALREHKSIADIGTQAPAQPAPADAVDEDDSDEPIELSIHRMIPGLWHLSHKNGIASLELVASDEADEIAVMPDDHPYWLEGYEAARKRFEIDIATLQGDMGRLQAELAAARDALELCRHPDVVGFYSAEEVAARYFATLATGEGE